MKLSEAIRCYSASIVRGYKKIKAVEIFPMPGSPG
jgi:hypothetical protein